MQSSNKKVDSVKERRVRPIYDYLDNGNNKKALHEAEKVLKKQKNFEIALALKALALNRLGFHTESEDILDKILISIPTDISTLQIIRICFNELNKNKKIILAYENAIKKMPNNEELYTQLFMALVHENDYKNQKITAMNLYKLFPKNPYYFWAVMSTYMQATNNNSNINDFTLLVLTQRMIEKFIYENKIESYFEIELYLLILEKLNKHHEVLEVMNNMYNSFKFNSYDLELFEKKKAEHYFQINKFGNSFEIYIKLIEKNPDVIQHYLKIIEIILLEKNENQKIFSLKFFDFLNKLDESCSSKKNKVEIRCYYLANIEVYLSFNEYIKKNPDCFLNELIKKKYINLTEILYQYYYLFGNKQAFIFDFAYLNEKYNFSSQTFTTLIEKVKLNLNENFTNTNELIFHLNYIALLQISGYYDLMNKLDKLEEFKKLLRFYEKSLIVKGDNYSKTESHAGDFYFNIAVYLFNFLDLEKDDDIILNLIIALQYCVKKSSANYILKIFLINLYNLTGAIDCSFNIFEKLKVKFIMHDTLGYLIFDQCINLNHFNLYSKLIKSFDKFYSSNSKETFDYLTLCYKFGYFAKVTEILNLKKRLSLSVQHFSLDLDKITIDLITSYRNFDQLHTFLNNLNLEKIERELNKNVFYDNRDFTIYKSYIKNVTDYINKTKIITNKDQIEIMKLKFDQYKIIVKLENLVHIKIFDCENIKQELIDNLNELLINLKFRINNIESEITKDNFIINVPHSKFKSNILFNNKFKQYFSLVKLCLDLIQDKELNFNELDQVLDFFNELVQKIKNTHLNITSFVQVVEFFEYLNFYLINLSICLIMLIFINHLMIKKNNLEIKKKKKDKTKTENEEEFVIFLKKIKLSCNALINYLNQIEFKQFDKKFDEISIKLEILSEQNTINKIINSTKTEVIRSYTQSVKNVVDVLVKKVKLIAFLEINRKI